MNIGIWRPNLVTNALSDGVMFLGLGILYVDSFSGT